MAWRYFRCLQTAVVALLASTFGAYAIGPTPHRVSGSLQRISESVIVVKKGGTSWEFMRTRGTRLLVRPKIGARVTVEYTATAVKVLAGPQPRATREGFLSRRRALVR